MLAMVFFVYSAGVVEINKDLSTINPYFTNADPSRIILVKDDKTQFTEVELLELSELDHVRGVFNNDIVFDSEFITKKFNTVDMEYDFFYFKPLAAISLNDRDLIRGRLPENENEVVIGNSGIFNIGDPIQLANNHLLLESQDLGTDQFSYIIVGIVEEPETLTDDLHYMYLTNEGLSKLANSSVYENSEIQIQIDGTEKYDMSTDTWITPEMNDTVDTANRTYMISYATWVSIDNSVADGEILADQLMFFEICRDFKYKKEVLDDMEAGLCDALAFVQSHEITYRAITKYNNDSLFQNIDFVFSIDDEGYSDGILYMNQATYDYYFTEENYQISVIVQDSLDGVKVLSELEELGYHAFYPYQIVSSTQAASIVVHNLVVMMVVAIIVFAIFFVGYFVIRNLVFSKQRDYLILRSIGTTKHAIKQILRGELAFITLISILIIAILVFISEMFIDSIPQILRFFVWSDYLVLTILVIIVVELMSIQFTKKVFKVGVISALKGVDQ